MDNVSHIANLKEQFHLLEKVKELGDENSSTLGFFPSKAFDDSASKGNVFVAYREDILQGYLLFRYVKSRNEYSITHLCINPNYRRKGIANLLVDKLKRLVKDDEAYGISLHCREDYGIDEFWGNLYFFPRGKKSGRSKKGSTLVKWWYKNPDKLSQRSFWERDESEDVKTVVLDMNIINDLNDNTEHTKEAEVLLASWIDGVEYVYTTESHNEIHRQKKDHLLEKFRKNLTQFEEVSAAENEFEDTLKFIKAILPGDKKSKLSDQKQLTHAIATSCDYFITRDDQILNKSRAIESIYGLKILRPVEFILELDNETNHSAYKPLSLASLNCSKRKVSKEEFNQVFDIFSISNERKTKFQNKLAGLITQNNADCHVYQIEQELSVFYCLINSSQNSIEVPFLRIKNNQRSATLLFKVISTIVQDSVNKGISDILITDEAPSDDSEIQEALEAFGFTLSDKGFIKTSIKDTFDNKSKLVDYIAGNHSSMSSLGAKSNSFQLEQLFWPVKIVDPNINTFVIPIEPNWAKELFDDHLASEDLFGACESLIFNNKNIYYRSKSLCGLSKNSRILWYVKKRKNISHSGTIKAISMLDHVEVGKPKALFKKYKNYGVYGWKDIYGLCKRDVNNDIMTIAFSRTELFTSPVPLNEIEEMIKEAGAIFNNFQQPIKIPENVFETVYKSGMDMMKESQSV